MSATLVVRPLAPRAFSRGLDDVEARQLAATLVRALEAGLEEAGRAVVMLDADGSVAHAGPVARALLEAYFPGDDLAALPGSLSRRLDADPEPLVVTGPRGRLAVRRIEHAGIDTAEVLLLEERRSGLLSAPALRRLGLTRRQAQVMGLVAHGASNVQIAGELVISVRTVEKHVEQICERLGVRNRVSAVTAALAHARNV